MSVLLELRDLRTHFEGPRGVARAVDGVSLELLEGETLGLVGESGCGKSVTGLSILGLVPPPGRIVAGQVLLRGVDLCGLPEEKLRRLRGEELAMVFQEPMTALNPVHTIGKQVAEAVRLHRGLSRSEGRKAAIEMLERVGIPAPAARADEYPHQLSGGMRQRVVIAMAMICRPSVLVADEPTTALDVTIQAQILELVRELQAERGTSVLLITHDLGVVAETAQRVAVMYAGKIVESAPTAELFARPRHPYTVGLLRSRPEAAQAGERLEAIPGSVPDALDFPTGCRFRTRCPLADELCAREEPRLEGSEGHAFACHHAREVPS